MASSFLFAVVLAVSLVSFSSLHASSSEFIHVGFSAISAAPAFLPQPLSPSSVSPTPSPDISPLFPTPGAQMPPSPSESSMPTIPASPSPPNPDNDMLAPGSRPELPVPPVSSPLPVSSSVSLISSSVFLVHCVFLLLGLVLPFCPILFGSTV